jgi:hypothetical protein
MMTPASGILFREVMKGGMALGESDPEAGERKGRRAGTTLVLRARVAIEDVQGFTRDPEHTGALEASISFEPLGHDLRTDSGVVKLFKRTDDPDLKLMVYRLTFREGSRDYCFEGTKHVRRRSVLHSWNDTTTLYCRLHAGRDTEGTVIGAGILHLAALDFARQLASFGTVNASTMTAKARALGGFGVFFARELVDTYLGLRIAG